jgi:hypothetical protein
LREMGVGAEQIVGELAHGLGLATHSGPTTPAAVAASCRDREPIFHREPWAVPEAWRALVRAARGDDLG